MIHNIRFLKYVVTQLTLEDNAVLSRPTLPSSDRVRVVLTRAEKCVMNAICNTQQDLQLLSALE